MTRVRKSLGEVFKGTAAVAAPKAPGRTRQVNALVEEELALEAAAKAKRERRKFKDVVAALLAMYVDGRVKLPD
jgi:uncharacterized protein YfaS (alpha-2-macroglobulin family)